MRTGRKDQVALATKTESRRALTAGPQTLRIILPECSQDELVTFTRNSELVPRRKEPPYLMIFKRLEKERRLKIDVFLRLKKKSWFRRAPWAPFLCLYCFRVRLCPGGNF